MTQQLVILDPKDNVATSLANLKAGDIIELEVSGELRKIKLSRDIPFGHKFSLVNIKVNTPIIKYGEVIGLATVDIECGEYVHVHNLVSVRGRGDLSRLEI